MRVDGAGSGDISNHLNKPELSRIHFHNKLLRKMESYKFENIVNEVVTLQGRPVEVRSCPDQYVGLVRDLSAMHPFSMRVAAQLRPKHACVLLVLESPHVEEFIGEPGPAKGATGEMIKHHLVSVLGLPSIHDYGVLLVNAIQHQCSLGTNTRVYRDRIFRAVWANGGESDFRSRVHALFRPGDVLVNCCTKGNDFEMYGPLRNLVDTTLQASIPRNTSMRRTHPASWFDAKWRGQEWRV